jgi:hypothetical protein
MAHPAYLCEKARELRTEKLSLLEISARLALPKTTIFYWIRDLPNPELKYADTPARARSRAKAARSNVARFKALRDAAYRRGWDEYAELSTEPTFRDFVTLFLAEGYKRTRNKVSVANSDPAVLSVCQRWIRRLSGRKLTYSIQYHADQIHPSLIRLQRKSNSNGLAARTWRSRYGVLTVTCSDTYLRSRMQAWMDCLREQWLDSATAGV